MNCIREQGASFFEPGSDGNVGAITVGPAGDVNLDGTADVVFGAAGADPDGHVDAGKAYLVFGSPVPRPQRSLLSDLGGSVAGLTVKGFEAGDRLGNSVGGGFDVNGDGVSDVLVGAPFADSLTLTPEAAGETYVISPVSPSEVITLRMLKTAPGTQLEWTRPHRAIRYNIYRGDLASIRAAGGVRTSTVMPALSCGVTTDADADGLPDTIDASMPLQGKCFGYLVSARNATGEGPLEPAGASYRNDAQCP